MYAKIGRDSQGTLCKCPSSILIDFILEFINQLRVKDTCLFICDVEIPKVREISKNNQYDDRNDGEDAKPVEIGEKHLLYVSSSEG